MVDLSVGKNVGEVFLCCCCFFCVCVCCCLIVGGGGGEGRACVGWQRVCGLVEYAGLGWQSMHRLGVLVWVGGACVGWRSMCGLREHVHVGGVCMCGLA